MYVDKTLNCVAIQLGNSSSGAMIEYFMNYVVFGDKNIGLLSIFKATMNTKDLTITSKLISIFISKCVTISVEIVKVCRVCQC